MTTPLKTAASPRRKADIAGIHPLTAQQQGVLFHARETGDGGEDPYFSLDVIVLEGAVDADMLQVAWADAVARHPILRSDFRWEDVPSPLQIVFRTRPATLERLDWRGEPDPDTALSRYQAERRSVGFDLAHAADPRLTLIQLSGQRWFLLWAYHHIAVDGWSYAVVLRDLLASYEARLQGVSPNLPPARSFVDYLAWLGRQDTPGAEAFWQRQLRDFDAPTPLPLQRPDRSTGSRWAEFGLPVASGERLRSFVARERITLNTLVQGLWGLLLSRLNACDRVVFGITVSGRPADLPGAEDMAGLFITSLPLQLSLRGGQRVGDWLRELQAQNAELRQHEHLPLARVLTQAPAGTRALFDSLLVVENFPVDEALKSRHGSLRARPYDAPSQDGVARATSGRNNYPLTLVFVPGDTPRLVFAYDRHRFDDLAVRALGAQAQTLLEAMLAGADAPLDSLGLATQHEGERLRSWGQAAAPAWSGSLPEQVDRWAAEQPDSVAVHAADAVLDFAALTRRAGWLASRLLADGVRAEDRIGLLAERSAAYVVGVLAVMKAGAVFVPLDPAQPEQRLRELVDDADLALVLAQDLGLGERIAAGRPLVALHAREEPAPEGRQPVPAGPRPDQAAYVIYTSGSTGRPKGVLVSHGGLAQYTAGLLDRLQIPSGLRFAMVSTVAADLGHTMLFGALASGGTLHMLPAPLAFDPDGFADWMESHAVDVLKIVPGHLGGLLDAARPALPRAALVLGGEAATPALLDRVRRLAPGLRMLNHYGPTETTVGVLTHEFVPGDGCPLGRPLPGVRLRVLDRALQPVPAGATGELYVGGNSLARGYLGRPDLTADRFVPDPCLPGARLYRTGDRVRWSSQGLLHFLGRSDDQVKIRGHRVEPAELAAALRDLEGVTDAAVTVNDGRLLAYVTPADVDPDELLSRLKARLPEALLPAHLTPISALPLTSNGKLDRKALPDPGALKSPGPAPASSPRSDTEQILADIWAAVLGRETVGIHDNFFALGGDSILNLQVIARARRQGLRFTPRQLFEQPTIAGLAQLVTDAVLASPPVTKELEASAPLTPIQQWFFSIEQPSPHHWNQSIALRPDRPVDPQRLDASLCHLVARHAALRLRFVHTSQGWRQQVAPELPMAMLERVSLPASDETALRKHADALQRGLHIETGPLLKALLIDCGPADTRLLLAAHHLAIDSVSWHILVAELQCVYEQLASGQPPSLPAIPVDYLTWAKQLAGHATSLQHEVAYWNEVSVDAVRWPDRAGNTYGAAREQRSRLSKELTAALSGPATRRLRCSTEELLVCALAQALCHWQDTAGITFEMEGHGREALAEQADVSQTVGWFTCRYPVHVVPGTTGGATALHAVKEQLRRVPGKGAGHGLLLGQGLLAPAARPWVSFNYLGDLDRGLADGWLQLADIQPGNTRAADNLRTQWLDVDMHISGGQLQVSWTHCPAVHSEPQIKSLAADFQRRVEALATALTAADNSASLSDFPLARLAPTELDRLLARWPSLQDIYPLAPLQAGLLYHGVAEDGAGLHLNQLHLAFRALAKPELLTRAWNDALAAHAILRTAFVWQGIEEPHQVVLPSVQMPVREMDWRDWAPLAVEDGLKDLLKSDLAQGFAFDTAPLMRLTLVQTDHGFHMVWTRHHLLLDGWSSNRLLIEVFERHAAALQGRRPRVKATRPYRDHIEHLQRRSRGDDIRFWREQLQGLSQPTLLQQQMPATSRAVGMGRQRHSVSAALCGALQVQARAQGVTLNTVLQAAWAWLLSRHCARRDVVFGITVAGRSVELAGHEEMLGLFINTVPLRVQVPVATPLAAWWKELQATNAALREHDQAQLAELQSLAGTRPGTPLFDTLLVFENYPVDAAALRRIQADLDVSVVEAQETISVPLTVIVYPGEELSWEFAYRRDCFAEADLSDLGVQLGEVLRQFATASADPVASFSLLGDRGQSAGSERGHAPVWNPPKRRTLVESFERQVERRPDAIAVTCGDVQVDYRGLDARANALASRLLDAGAGPERSVALCVGRSVDLVVAILAVLKTGACYVPLDAEAPLERLRHIVGDSAAGCLLHDSGTESIGRQLGLPLLRIDGLAESGRTFDAQVSIHPDNLAYVIYTSGSTGLPKGVAVTHTNALRLFEVTQTDFEFGADDVWTLFHSCAFDFSVWELWGALLNGGRLVIVPSDTARDQQAFLQLLADEGVTVLNQTPSAFYRLAEQAVALPAGSLALRQVIFGGEALDPRRLKPWFDHFGELSPRMVNMYGITETTVHVTYRPLGQTDLDGGSLIGQALGDLQLYVLDDAMQRLPAGVTGELYVGGAGLARGYLGRPDLTAERFVPDPFSTLSGQRLYRSGDLARRTLGGDVRYEGRADQQVKLRGYRIELGEVEAAMRRHPQVEDTVVLAEPDGEGAPRLLCFVVGEGLDEDQLRGHALAHLPGYMVPAVFSIEPVLPLTLNGKLDRQALLDREPAARQASVALPRNELERSLAVIWADLLGLDAIGINDNFFALGGHSLLATRAVTRMRDATGIRWAIADLFAHPTIAGLAALHPHRPATSAGIDFMAGLLDQLEQETQ